MTCRRSPGTMIPWIDIQHWAEANHLAEAQVDDLHAHIRALDITFLTWKAARDARNAAATK